MGARQEHLEVGCIICSAVWAGTRSADVRNLHVRGIGMHLALPKALRCLAPTQICPTVCLPA